MLYDHGEWTVWRVPISYIWNTIKKICDKFFNNSDVLSEFIVLFNNKQILNISYFYIFISKIYSISLYPIILN